MATIVIERREREKHTSYIVRYKDPLTGTPKYYKTYRRLKDAQAACNRLRELIDTGKSSNVQTNRKMALLSFGEVADERVKEWQKLFDIGELRPKTFEEYQYRVRVLKRKFDKSLLCEITKEDLLDYQKAIFKQLSAVTANRNLFVIKQVFKHGMEMKAIFENPAENIRYLSEKEHERNRFLLPSEIEELVAASRKTKAKYYLPALIYLGAEHGASKQECLDLEWGDINFEYSGLGMINLFRTKNGCERTEYIMPRTKEALMSWRKHLVDLRNREKIEGVDSNLVFVHADGSPMESFKSAWKATCSIAGFKDLHFHDLRHTFCSNLILSGADMKSVKEMIGHRDISMTDRYSHLTQGYKRLLQERLSQHYTS
jgi:site-specific recombinase XerD